MSISWTLDDEFVRTIVNTDTISSDLASKQKHTTLTVNTPTHLLDCFEVGIPPVWQEGGWGHTLHFTVLSSCLSFKLLPSWAKKWLELRYYLFKSCHPRAAGLTRWW
jgi:hypothetical protein